MRTNGWPAITPQSPALPSARCDRHLVARWENSLVTEIHIPESMKPVDGRFGSGPAKIPLDAIAGLTEEASVLGTSHRQAPVKSIVNRIRGGLRDLFALPDGYEIVL